LNLRAYLHILALKAKLLCQQYLLTFNFLLKQYYPRAFFNFLFGEILRTPQVAERNCKILKDSCSSTFEDNCYAELGTCVDEMFALPAVAIDGAIDGKVISCRTLHGSFAATNEAHCPHMSFDPQYDPECNVKCQESNSLPDTEMFLDDELAYFAAFSQAIGLGEDQWVSPSIFLPA
jgi:hypothetical protein